MRKNLPKSSVDRFLSNSENKRFFAFGGAYVRLGSW